MECEINIVFCGRSKGVKGACCEMKRFFFSFLLWKIKLMDFDFGIEK